MFLQIVIGIVVIFVTAVIHASTFAYAFNHSERLFAWVGRDFRPTRFSIAFGISCLWVMSAHLIEVLLWGLVYIGLDVFDAFEPALYFSLTAYTTLGFGDIVLDENWRLLSGLTAANGFLAFAWSIGFQMEYVRLLWEQTSTD